MAYTDTVGDIWRMTAAFTVTDGQVEEFDINYRIAISGGGDSRAGVLAANNANIVTNILPGLATVCSFYGSKLSAIKTAAPYSPIVLYDGSPGGDIGFPLPTQTRGLASWRTALAGRAYRGRTYLPTTTVNAITSTGNVPTSLATAWLAWATAVLPGIVSGGTTWVPGVFHRVPTAVISSTFDQFTSVTISNLFATQRRSGGYGRPNNPPF